MTTRTAFMPIAGFDSPSPTLQILFWLRATAGFARYLCRTILRHSVALVFDLFVAPVEIGFLGVFLSSYFTHERLTDLTPGLVFYTIMTTTLVSTPCHMVLMKETKLLRRFRASPLPASALVAGMVCGSGMVSLASSIATYVVAHEVVGIAVPAQLLLTMAVWVIALATMTSLGMVVASLFSHAQNAIATALPVLFVNMALSGLFWAPGAMPRVAGYLSWATPARPACDWLRAAATSHPLPHAWEPMLVLAWLVVLGWTAMRRFTWE